MQNDTTQDVVFADATSTLIPGTQEVTVTPYFKTPTSALVWHQMHRILLRWGAPMAAVPMALVAVSLLRNDLRWALVALMCVMIVIPMILVPVYLAIVTKPEVVRQVLPHRLVIRHGVDVTIEYLRDPDDTRCLPQDYSIPWHRVTLLRPRGNWWELHYTQD